MTMRKNTTTTVNWPEIIAFTEDCIVRARLRSAQLEALLTVFKSSQQAGDPAPEDLISSAKQARKHAEPMIKHRATA
jgi:hypothetical protein